MNRFFVRRVITVLLLMFLMTAIVFTLVSFTPGGMSRIFPIRSSSIFDIARERSSAGLDVSPARHYFAWMAEVLQGNWGGVGGATRGAGAPMAEVLWERLKVSLNLIIPGLLFAVIVGLVIGVYSALKPRSLLTRFFNGFSMLGISIPDFAVGLLLILLFVVYFRWLPVGGYYTFGRDLNWFDVLVIRLKHLILPTITISLGYIATFSEHVKTSVSLVMQEDYIRTARSKGLKERVVIFKHALRNSMIPILAAIFSSFPFFFGGMVIVERLFNWPGLGSLVYRNVVSHMGDFYVVLFVTGFVSFLSLLGSLISDFLYSLVDPRVRNPLEGEKEDSNFKNSLLLGAVFLAIMIFYNWRLAPLYENAENPFWFFIGLGVLIAGIGVLYPFLRKIDEVPGKENSNTSFQFSLPSLKINWLGIRKFLRNLVKPGIIVGLIIFVGIGFGFAYYSSIGYQTIDDIPTDLRNRNEPMSLDYIFGTDHLGRSVLTVVLVTAGETMKLVFTVTLIGVFVGTFFGVIMGFIRGPFDRGMMSIFDLLTSVPTFFLVFLLMGMIADDNIAIIFALSAFSLIELAKIVRAQMLAIKEYQFVEAAFALGNSRFQILGNHLLRNVFPLIWGQGLILFGRNMVLLSSLGYLKVIETNTWGFLAGNAGRDIRAIGPIVMIFLVVLAANLIGKGVFGSLDPLKR